MTLNNIASSGVDDLESIIDSIISPLAVLDTEFNFVLVNRAYAELDERKPELFKGKNHFDLYPNEENRTIFQRVVDSAQAHQAKAKPFEYAENPERGATYWDWTLSPLTNNDGVATGLILSLIDVTDRTQAQESLSRKLLDQEIVASILRLSLQPHPLQHAEPFSLPILQTLLLPSPQPGKDHNL